MRFNEMYIFPFEEIRRGSDIIIYGIGNVGKSFFNQATALQYCNVVATVDKEADKWGVTRYNTVRPDQIGEFTYDFLVIAVASQVTAEQIRHELSTQYDVPNEKIVFSANRRTPISMSNTSLSQWIDSHEIVKKELEQFWKERVGDVSYFRNVTDEILKLRREHREKETDALISYFRQYLKEDNKVKDKLVVLRLLYMIDCFDREAMQIFIQTLEKLDDYDARMWLLYDLSVMEGNEPECRYDEYYLDKRRVMGESAAHYYENNGAKERNVIGRRVAITCFTMGNERSSHNALVIPYANEMVRQGCEVAIFPMDLFRYRYGECFIQPMVPLEQCARDFAEDHRKLLDSRVKVFYNEGESIQERVAHFMSALAEYTPSVVYDVCGEYSFLSSLVKQSFYVVALPLRGYASSACFDKYMCRDKEICISENERYHSVREEQMVEALVCSYAQTAKKEYRREDYGIANDVFVITTVGERLKKELTSEFVDCVCAFLEENPKTCWILVGEKIGSYVKEQYGSLFAEKRIIEWGYEKDLIGFYTMCDVYWNPNRMGAGGSIVGAMRCGIPIVTTDFPSDILPRLGKENAIKGGYGDCRRYVERLYKDPAFYMEKSELMRERMKISSVAEYVRKLLEVGENGSLRK